MNPLETERQWVIETATHHRWIIAGRGSSVILTRGKKTVTVMFSGDARVIAAKEAGRPVTGPRKAEAVLRILRRRP